MIIQTGPEVVDVLERHPADGGAPPDAVTTVLVAVCGYFAWYGSLAPPPGLPGVRAFQRAPYAGALLWLRRRLPAF